jgi:hypothetical protein
MQFTKPITTFQTMISHIFLPATFHDQTLGSTICKYCFKREITTLYMAPMALKSPSNILPKKFWQGQTYCTLKAGCRKQA